MAHRLTVPQSTHTQRWKFCTLPSQYEVEYCSLAPTQRILNSCNTALAWENLEPCQPQNIISEWEYTKVCWYWKLPKIPYEEWMQIAKDVAWYTHYNAISEVELAWMLWLVLTNSYAAVFVPKWSSNPYSAMTTRLTFKILCQATRISSITPLVSFASFYIWKNTENNIVYWDNWFDKHIK